jgi:thiamine transporter ThiT
MNVTQNRLKNLTAAAICLALCILLPYLTGNNQQLGNILSLMHIPVLLCGFICGPYYAGVVGLIAPLLRSVLLAAPPLFIASAMSPELAVYGLAAGFLYRKLAKTNDNIYISLIAAMIAGRVTYGIAGWLLYSVTGLFRVPFAWGWTFFINAALLTAAPGIILHIVLIPVIVIALKRSKIITQ